MSEPKRLKVHYCVGTICEGLYGVDLSGFPQVSMVYPNMENERRGTREVRGVQGYMDGKSRVIFSNL